MNPEEYLYEITYSTNWKDNLKVVVMTPSAHDAVKVFKSYAKENSLDWEIDDINPVKGRLYVPE